MRVRSVSLSSDSCSWLSEVKGTTNYRSKSSAYSLERLAGSGRVQDLSRHLNLQLTSVLAAFRVSGDCDLLEEVYVVMQRERGTLRDTNRDGYLDWRYEPGASLRTNERLNTAQNTATTTKELTTTVTTSISKLEASLEQLEAVKEELATERQNYFYLSRALETAVARLHHREQARWRRTLSLLLTVVLSAATGAASFGVFLWLVYRGSSPWGRRVQRL